MQYNIILFIKFPCTTFHETFISKLNDIQESDSSFPITLALYEIPVIVRLKYEIGSLAFRKEVYPQQKADLLMFTQNLIA